MNNDRKMSLFFITTNRFENDHYGIWKEVFYIRKNVSCSLLVFLFSRTINILDLMEFNQSYSP